MSNNARVNAVRVAKEQAVLVPGALLLFLSSVSSEPHINLRLPHPELLAGVMSALRRDAGGDVYAADRLIPAREYAETPAHVFALWANHLSGAAQGDDRPVAPAPFSMDVEHPQEWYALPLLFCAPYFMVAQGRYSVVELTPGVAEVIDGLLRTVIDTADYVELHAVVMHRALVPSYVEGRTVAAIEGLAKKGALRDHVPAPFPAITFELARWPQYILLPGQEDEGRPFPPEIKLPRNIDPETAERIEAAGWRVRCPQVLRLVH